ncbi:MAG: hypothetical protein Q4F12_04965 [Erysipelotrichaceae bacterium]|nr:hypothetical protein [Erysipelotrichaceae bacterium]
MKKIVSVNCKACGAPITVDPTEETVRCTYCDAVMNVAEILNQTDDVQIEKIKAKAYKEVEMQKYDKEQAKAEVEQYKKSKLSKWTKIWAVLSLLCGVAFLSRSFICFLVALIQCACLVVSYLMGMKIIPEKKKSLHVVLAFAGFLLTIVFFLTVSLADGGSSYKPEKVTWEDTELSEIISKPDTEEFDSYNNWDRQYSIDANNMTEKQFNTYIQELKDSGFNIEIDEGNNDFSAYNSDGYKIKLYYYSSNKEVSIDLYKPIEVNNITWPSSELVSKIPTPKSAVGKINSESDKRFDVYVKNENSEDYSEYVTACIDAGFNIDYERSESRFSGKNSEGDSLTVSYEGFNIMNIEIEKAEEPVVEENTTKNESDNTETVEEETTQNDSSIIRPEIKAAIDSYETFVDEYCEFLTKYNASQDTTSMLIDYANYMTKMADFEAKMDAIENENLNAVEDAYYSEVLLRCSQKMLKAANQLN